MRLDLPKPPTWTEQAVCASVDPELFFPEKGGPTRSAIAVCHGCPVAAQCLQLALDSNAEHGIWGGLTREHRRRMSTRKAAA